jgi:CelD/BcsL family acetyltransferase involved in cellulose biosynthesis
MNIQKITSFAEFEALSGPWNELLGRSHYNILFLHHDWLSAWWNNFSQSDWQMVVLLVSDGENLVAAAPLVRKINQGGLANDTIEFWANSHTFRTDFIVDKDHDRAQVLRLIWEYLMQSESGWDLIKLKDLADENESTNILLGFVSNDSVSASKEELIETPFLPIESSWDEYFNSRSKNHRKNMRRALRKMEDDGGWELVMFDQAAAIREQVDKGFEIEGSGWKRENNSSILSDERITSFYRDLAGRFADLGLMRLFFLRFAGTDVAFDFCIFYQGRVYALKTGYDESYAAYSPGQILQMTELEKIFTLDQAEYDFIGPKMDFKTRWTDHLRNHWTLYIYGKTIRGRMLALLNLYLLPAMRKSQFLRKIKEMRN